VGRLCPFPTRHLKKRREEAMKKLTSLSAICGGLLFVGVCVGLITAGPSVAQGLRPPSDVRVVNTAGEAVPVIVQSLPAVQIGGTPTVNVGNTPSVNVSSLPAVQVGNGAGNPIPVNVTNLPSAESAGEPVVYVGTVYLPVGGTSSQSAFFPGSNIPAGKRLVLDLVTYRIVGGNADDPPLAFYEDTTQYGLRYYISPDDHFANGFGTVIQVSTKQVGFRAGPTQQPTVGISRVSTGPAAVMDFSLHGRLLDVP
jgi:hypothetical protein